MSKASSLYRLLQLNGGTFPTGGFSQSWGLETFVAEGTVHDAETFSQFLETYLISCIGKCEGPIICRAYQLAGEAAPEAAEKLTELEQLSNAVKVTKESREGGIRMGRAFRRVVEPNLDEASRQRLSRIFPTGGVSYPVIYGVVCRMLDIDLEEAIEAYIFSTINTLTQSALKLIPLGNIEAQNVIFTMEAKADEVRCLCLETPIEEITNFCPGIDIASLRHEELPVRLYMS